MRGAISLFSRGIRGQEATFADSVRVQAPSRMKRITLIGTFHVLRCSLGQRRLGGPAWTLPAPRTALRLSGAYRLLKSRITTVAKSYTRNLAVYFPVKRLRSLAAGLLAGLLLSAPAWCQAYVPSSVPRHTRSI
jgi:hypothetical protein